MYNACAYPKKCEMKILKAIVLMACLLCAQLAAAMASSGSEVVFGTSVVPVQGMWWNETRAGSGYNLAIDEKGYIVLSWLTYRVDGTPTFYVMSGQFVTPCGNSTAVSNGCLAQKLEWSRTGIIGRLTSPIYEATNGACPTCEYRRNSVLTSALGTGEVVFYGNRVADLKFLDKVVRIYPQPLIATIDDQLKGDWTGKVIGSLTYRFVRAADLDGKMRQEPDPGRLDYIYVPSTIPNESRIYRVFYNQGFRDGLLAVEPNGRIYWLRQRGIDISFALEIQYQAVDEVFLDGNRMVRWDKNAYRPRTGSTVGMPGELEIYRIIAPVVLTTVIVP